MNENISINIIKMHLENLQQDLKKWKKNYNAVADKKRRESDPVEEDNLQLKLDNIDNKLNDIANKIDEKEKQLQKIKQQAEEDNIQCLLNILTELKNSNKEIAKDIQNAYRACSPEDWVYLKTEKPEEILADVEKMSQGGSKYTRVERFVACLFALIKTSSSGFRELKNWAYENINEFSDLLEQEKENLAEKRKKTNSYLLMVLEKSNQDSARNNSDCYTVQAWIIPDIKNYNPETSFGSKKLTLPDDDIDNKTFSIDQIPEKLNLLLEESSKYYHFDSDFTIEIFLPFHLLDYDIDCWEFKDPSDLDLSNLLNDAVNDLKIEDSSDFDSSQKILIGQKYKVVVRSYDRWTISKKSNQYRNCWKKKCNKLKGLTKASACSAFLLGSDKNVNNLIFKLETPEIIGLKVVKALQKKDKLTIFSLIIKTAIPVALWVRHNPPELDCQSKIEEILNSCNCIHDLPEVVKKKRLDAKQNVDTHIGSHLSLLWEDPDRLPPTNFKLSMPSN